MLKLTSIDSTFVSAHNRVGLPITCRSSRAAALYRGAEHRILNSQGGVGDLLDRALALDPSFALAQLARDIFVGGPQGGDSASMADRSRRTPIREWERGHIDALCALANGAPNAEETARAHLRAVPADLLVLSNLAGHLFFCGGPGKRQAVLELYESAALELGDDPAVLARLGFAASEVGQYQRGRSLLERALHSDPASLYAIHALAHLLHDTGDHAASSSLLESWLRQNPGGGSLHGHVQWHLALAEWNMGRRAEARARYRQYAAPEATPGGPLLALADAAGWLFRRHLDGVPASALPSQGVRDLIDRLRPSMHQPFVALHATAALAALGDTEALGECVRVVEDSAEGGSVAVRVARAVHSYGHGRYRKTVDILESLTPAEREGVGGSNVERELLELLHARAALADYVRDLRRITAGERDPARIVEQVRPRARRLAAVPGLVQVQHRQCDPAQGFGVHLLHQEDDGSNAVYIIAWLPGRGTPPHNHKTWGVVAGISGVERETRWKRDDDGSRSGLARLRRVSEADLGPGDVSVVLPEDIHDVRNGGHELTISLHTYGHNINSTGRSEFDVEAGTEKKYVLTEVDHGAGGQ